MSVDGDVKIYFLIKVGAFAMKFNYNLNKSPFKLRSE